MSSASRRSSNLFQEKNLLTIIRNSNLLLKRGIPPAIVLNITNDYNPPRNMMECQLNTVIENETAVSNTACRTGPNTKWEPQGMIAIIKLPSIGRKYKLTITEYKLERIGLNNTTKDITLSQIPSFIKNMKEGSEKNTPKKG